MFPDFDFVPVFHLVGVLVHVYPVELRGAGADGRDEPFALPAPIVLRVREKVACEGVPGGFFEFEFVFERYVEVLGYLDVELGASRRKYMQMASFCRQGQRGANLVIFLHHHASIDLRTLRRGFHARCNEIGLLSAMFLFGVFVLPGTDCFGGANDGGTCCYCCQESQDHDGFVSPNVTVVTHESKQRQHDPPTRYSRLWRTCGSDW